uniref:UBC core domain-containing protein n=1 Tax=Chromera velia CCMP2878 TaxID=1169474 RepID=A0A0G4HVZ5_9ALVE|mmetsp:Transcript_54062/g.105773  ORF Transcript_54062/g.105773 Transcript_54062/m.105773 type:complete len:277 (-) Transcript_54062:251-1081(-)|eukprot:Cvel_8933.t1-p1 / transcript=Cvel_8933.t1 / gene=Cvel_8933 / organism=Chromera_velia_CCMP2878 / gene_product=Probable ubiquitin-conjugating enzyme E2 12, putative / transcript_product=Probable ubiquitin-conjugating enzyme E2 12, putative / location=Cvel_scaffold503:13887-14714(+) / protein_length=276 / sequence_SO=supercontig / SO=protein_coding / is_pseudo=false
MAAKLSTSWASPSVPGKGLGRAHLAPTDKRFCKEMDALRDAHSAALAHKSEASPSFDATGVLFDMVTSPRQENPEHVNIVKGTFLIPRRLPVRRLSRGFLCDIAASRWDDRRGYVEIRCTSQYPFVPPKVKLSFPNHPEVFFHLHPFLDNEGQPIVDILSDQWSPANTTHKVLESLQSLMAFPEDFLPDPRDLQCGDSTDKLEWWKALLENSEHQEEAERRSEEEAAVVERRCMVQIARAASSICSASPSFSFISLRNLLQNSNRKAYLVWLLVCR